MSIETENSGPSLRDQVEASYASHTPSPDIDSIVSGAREEHDREVRSRSKPDTREGEMAHEGNQSDRRRSAIRKAFADEKLKLAHGGSTPAKGAEVKAGPPTTWDSKAKAAWHEQPQEIRLAAKREEAGFKTAMANEVMPQMQQYAELDRVLAPSRERFKQFGVKSDAEAVHSLLQWEAAIANPATQKTALLNLMRQYGVNPQELAGAPQHYQQQVAPELVSAATQQVSQFGQGRAHFESVRDTMGYIIRERGARYLQADGSVNLDAAYRDACRIQGIGGNTRRPSSPPSRAPTGHFDDTKRGSGIRGAIVGAVREVRGGGR